MTHEEGEDSDSEPSVIDLDALTYVPAPAETELNQEASPSAGENPN